MLHLDDPRQLWRRYLLALGIVVALLAASHWASVRSLSGGEEASAVINISGRQRMLSQRILFLSAASMDPDASGVDPRLSQAVDLFERSHMALLQGGDLGLSPEEAAARAGVYAEVVEGDTLDELSRTFVVDARLVIDGWWPADEAAWSRMRDYGSTTLLKRLDQAVQAFEADARESTRLARRIALTTFALALLVLAAEAALIFWPAQRTVSAAIRRLREANAALVRSGAEAEAARDEARLAAQARTQFLANMSHELRTPLNGVMGMLDLLQDATDPGVRERARTAHASASHLLDLLGNVLDVSRLESGRISLETLPFDPRRLVREAVRVVSDQADAKGIELRLEEDGPLPAAVAGDPTRLRQVAINLVGNAVKFTDAGEVVVRLRHEGDRLGIEVADTGIGIPAEAQATLFDPFVQADASTTRRFGGTGLGLAICRQIVAAMDGRIGVESAPGQGATFRLEVRAPVATLDRPGVPMREARPLRVLVAEDNAVNRRVADAFLRRLGHDAVCVEDGARAVEAVRDAEPAFDAVLMDVQMPVMDGIEATRTIRALGPRGALPILALTANAREVHRDELAEAGMDGHLTKPVRAEALSEALSEAMADAAWTARNRDADALRRASA